MLHVVKCHTTLMDLEYQQRYAYHRLRNENSFKPCEVLPVGNRSTLVCQVAMISSAFRSCSASNEMIMLYTSRHSVSDIHGVTTKSILIFNFFLILMKWQKKLTHVCLFWMRNLGVYFSIETNVLRDSSMVSMNLFIELTWLEIKQNIFSIY